MLLILLMLLLPWMVCAELASESRDTDGDLFDGNSDVNGDGDDSGPTSTSFKSSASCQPQLRRAEPLSELQSKRSPVSSKYSYSAPFYSPRHYALCHLSSVPPRPASKLPYGIKTSSLCVYGQTTPLTTRMINEPNNSRSTDNNRQFPLFLLNLFSPILLFYSSPLSIYFLSLLTIYLPFLVLFLLVLSESLPLVTLLQFNLILSRSLFASLTD